MMTHATIRDAVLLACYACHGRQLRQAADIWPILRHGGKPMPASEFHRLSNNVRDAFINLIDTGLLTRQDNGNLVLTQAAIEQIPECEARLRADERDGAVYVVCIHDHHWLCAKVWDKEEGAWRPDRPVCSTCHRMYVYAYPVWASFGPVAGTEPTPQEQGTRGNPESESVEKKGGVEARTGIEPVNKGFADPAPNFDNSNKPNSESATQHPSGPVSGQFHLVNDETFVTESHPRGFPDLPDQPPVTHIWTNRLGILCGYKDRFYVGQLRQDPPIRPCPLCKRTLKVMRTIADYWPFSYPPANSDHEPTRLELLFKAIAEELNSQPGAEVW